MDNRVYYWWVFLSIFSFINIILWFVVSKKELKTGKISLMQWLCLIYVIVCGYRSILPRADVQRMMLFDTIWSSVFLGRSAATIAEMAFIIQWGILLHNLGKLYNDHLLKFLPRVFVTMIAVAEVFSWNGVLFKENFSHAYEETLWSLSFLFIVIGLVKVLPKMEGQLKRATLFIIIGCLFYIGFMFLVDVPMYYKRGLADQELSKIPISFNQALTELIYSRNISWSYQLWKEEIPWMTGYFTMAVYSSLGLCLLNFKVESKTKS